MRFELSAEEPQRRWAVPAQRKPVVSSSLDGRCRREGPGYRVCVDGKRIVPFQRRVSGQAKPKEHGQVQAEPPAAYEIRIGVVAPELLRRDAVQRNRTLRLVAQLAKVPNAKRAHAESRRRLPRKVRR